MSERASWRRSRGIGTREGMDLQARRVRRAATVTTVGHASRARATSAVPAIEEACERVIGIHGIVKGSMDGTNLQSAG